jgi:predicted AAA+ superfamily ATPase
MYFSRWIDPLFKKAVQSFPAVVLTGARQAGKTTFLRHALGPDYRYVLLDELDKRDLAHNDPRGFLSRYHPPLLIDEIQHVPDLLSYIKAAIDEHKQPGQWVITGSQHFNLMKNVAESLAGRAAILQMQPFSIAEALRTQEPPASSLLSYLEALNNLPSGEKKPASLDLGKWLLRGSYPELWEKPDFPQDLWYSSYIQTYLDRDVRGNIREENLYDFQRFLKLLAGRTATELDVASLSRELGISQPAVRSWIAMLERSSLIFLLPPYHANFGKRVIKRPKLYFFDTGLAAHLVGLQTPDHLLHSPMAGALFETAVVSNFAKTLSSLGGPEGCLYFWRAVSGIEVDLLIDLGGEIFPIEIKLTSTIYSAHYQSLERWQTLSGVSRKGFIVSQASDIGRLSPNVTAVPWYLL